MWHTVFITLHAVSGTIAFLAGCVALRRGVSYQLYLWSLVGMLLFVVLAIAVEWSTLDTVARILFTALVALGAVMVWRGALAGRVQPPGTDRYRDHIGFTLIGLADAFLVVAVLNLGAPGWLVAAVGVAVAIAGHYTLRFVKRRLAPVR